ncbi:unnamed protein product, partial [Phaeothamnion confervicola]
QTRRLPLITSNLRRLHIAVPAALLATLTGGCAIATVADTAVTVVATTAKVGANVVGAASDVARAGVRAVANSFDQKR